MASGLENIETVESPFRRFVTTIGVFPTAFTDAMTYYDCLAYLVKYMEDTLIPAINENAEAVEELQRLYIQLKSYVDNYFDNLDVQEEINNKLDDMVEAGTLQEIITEYIQANTAWCFDNVSLMKSATNFVNGSYARTLGYHSINDGGGMLYKIRTITNDDVVDESLIIALTDDTLIAEAILPTEVNAEMLGAYGDGVTDDSTKIQLLLDLNNNVKLQNAKTYLCNSPLTITKRKPIDFSFSTLKVGHTGVGLTINMETEDAYSHKRFTPRIENLVMDCGNASKGIYIDYAYKGYINNIYINNFLNIGMEKYRGYELVIDNLYFWASNQNTTSIGLLVSGNDCEFGNIFGINCHTGVKMIGGGNHFKNIHMWLFNDTQGNGMLDGDALYQDSAMIEIAGNDRYFIDYAYFDSYQYGFKYTGYGWVKLNSGLMYCPSLTDLTANYLSYPIYLIYSNTATLDYLYRFSISNLVYALSSGNTVTAKMIPDSYARRPIRIINSTIPFAIDNTRKDYISDFTFGYCTNVNVSANPIGDDKLWIHGTLKKDSDNAHGWRITPNSGSGYEPITINEIKTNFKDTSQYFTATPTTYSYNIGSGTTAEQGYTTVDDYYNVDFVMKINYTN